MDGFTGKAGLLPRGKAALSGPRKVLLSLLIASVALGPVPSFANPTGGTVVSGSATIDQSTAGQTVINQLSGKAVIDWHNFSIDAGTLTKFIQPGTDAAVLNRVTGGIPSSIMGDLTANGKVFIVNPHGIIVGGGAVINTNGFTATTLNVDSAEFMNGGDLHLSGSSTASIVNLGNINGGAGDVYLVARQVENKGSIKAGGEAGLGAGTEVLLTAAPVNGTRIFIEANEMSGALKDKIGIDNQGVIEAARAKLAAVDNNIYDLAIRNDGIVRARSMQMNADGTITLSAKGGTVQQNTGAILDAKNADGKGGKIRIEGDFIALGGVTDASGTSGGSIDIAAEGSLSIADKQTAAGEAGKGGNITFTAGGNILQSSASYVDVSGSTDGGKISVAAEKELLSSGAYNASGILGRGGNIDMTAAAIRLLSPSILARGKTIGGTVRVGGEYQGGKLLAVDEIQNAKTLAMASGTLINVAASSQEGDGGTAILWADDRALVTGTIKASGGAAGKGGFIETSAGESLSFGAKADAGKGGTLLLDPKNITIADVGAAQYSIILGWGYDYVNSLTEPDLGNNDLFGRTVSLDGNMLAVTARQDDGFNNAVTDSGAVYLFTFDDASFARPTLRGIIGDGYTGGKNYNLSQLDANDNLGNAVALDANRLAVSSYLDDGAGNASTDSGAVYLFSFADNTFSSPTLEATFGDGYTGGKNYDVANLAANDGFGVGLAMDGNRLLVAATYDDGVSNGLADAGAIYAFTFTDSLFSGVTLEAILGSGYTGGKNYNMTMLEASDSLGIGLALDGNRLAIGAGDADGFGNVASGSGEIYTFTFSNGDFTGLTHESMIGRGYTGGKNYNAANLAANDHFGLNISLEDNRLAVGAYQDDGGTNLLTNSGTVYLFTFSDSTFSNPVLQANIGNGYTGAKDYNMVNGMLAANDEFGISVSLDGYRLAVGSWRDDGSASNKTDTGSVYLFTFNDADFTGINLRGRIGEDYYNIPGGIHIAADAGDAFGRSLSMDGTRLALGSQADDGFGNAVADSGAVYLFTFDDTSFSNPRLQGIIGDGYSGGKNYNLTALDVDDRFGTSLALVGDRLAVGSYRDDGAGNAATDSGAVYLFSFGDSLFSSTVHEGTIGKGYTGGKNYNVANLANVDGFGAGLTMDGNRLVINGYTDDGFGNAQTDSGAVYLFTFDDDEFNNATLRGIIGDGYAGAGDYNINLDTSDLFGLGMSLDGNRLAIGAYGGDGSANAVTGSGEVYLFTFDDANFTNPVLQGRIGSGYAGGKNYNLSLAADSFGVSVSLDGNRLAVGAHTDDGSGNGVTDSGAVYLFTFTDSSFSGPSLAGMIGDSYLGAKSYNMALDASDLFGLSVDLDGNRLAIGANSDAGHSNLYAAGGGVFLFTFADTEFTAPYLSGRIGNGYVPGYGFQGSRLAANDYFGVTLSLDGNRLAVGAYGDDGATNGIADAGAVYLFSFADDDFSSPVLESIIGALYSGGKNMRTGNVAAGDAFGRSVALDGNRLAVGASTDDGSGNVQTDSGAVYLFTFNDELFSGGILQAVIGDTYSGGKNYNLNLDNTDNFGISLDLDGNRLAVGAYLDDGSGNSQTNSGAVYLFTFADAEFTTPTLVSTFGDGYAGYNLNFDNDDNFGVAVALDGNRLAAGAHRTDGISNTVADSGAVYLFTFANDSFSTPVLQSTIGNGYTGGKNYNFNAESVDYFGVGLSLKGNRLAIGSHGADGFANANADSGAMYIFEFSDDSFSNPFWWGTVGSGYAGSTDVNMTLNNTDRIGLGMDFDGARLVFSTYMDDGFGNGATDSGAVYFLSIVPDLSGSSWSYAASAGEDVTLSVTSLRNLLSSGQDVVLQASNDITLEDALTVNNAGGDGGNLTLQAGRSIFLNANITTDNGDLTLIGNDLAANGVVDADRDAGNAVIAMLGGTTVNTGAGDFIIDLRAGTGNTNNGAGAITLQTITSTGDVSINHALGGTVTQGGALAAAGLSLTGTGAIYTLTNAGNAITTLAANTGTVNFTENSGYAIGTVDGIDGVTAANLYLSSTGTVTQSQSVAVANASFAGNTANFELNTVANNIANMAAAVTGGQVLLDNGANNLAVGTVNAISGLAGDSFLISGSGAVTQTQAVTAGLLLLGGTGGTFTLNHASNDIDTLAVSGSGATVAFRDTDGFSIGAFGNGLNASSAYLNAGGAVTQTEEITAANLQLLGNAYTLNHAANDVDVLAANAASLSFTDADGLIIGAVNGTNGLTLAGNAILTAGGAVTQSQALVAAGLSILGAHAYTLNNAGNDIDTLAGNAASLSFTDADGLAIGTVGATNGLTLTGNATINAGGAMTQTQAVIASGLSLTGAHAYTLNNAGNDVDAITANAASLSFTDNDGFAIQGLALSGNAILTAGGAVTQTGAVAASGLAALGAAGYTLNHAGNAVSTVAANAAALDYSQTAGFTVGTVGATSGVTATGNVLLRATGTSSDITLAQMVSGDSDNNAAANDATVIMASRGLVNNAGVATGTGHFLVYTVHESLSTLNGLTADAEIYDLAYPNDPGALSLVNHADNVFIYNSPTPPAQSQVPVLPPPVADIATGVNQLSTLDGNVPSSPISSGALQPGTGEQGKNLYNSPYLIFDDEWEADAFQHVEPSSGGSEASVSCMHMSSDSVNCKSVR